MLIGQFIPGNSFLHRLDPRSKLLFVFSFVLLVFATKNPLSFLWLLMIIVIGMVFASIPIKFILLSFRPFMYLCIMLFIFHLWLTEGGTIIWHYSIFTIYEKGLTQGLLVVTRLLLLAFVASLLTLTTPSIQLADGLEKLLKPLERIKVPVHSLALMMSICLRFIPVIWEEVQRIQIAQRLRGASFSQGSWLQRFKSYHSVWIPIFLAIFRRADELSQAMEAKCYRGNIQRTQWRNHLFSHRDLYLLFVWFVMIMVFLLLRGG